MAQHLTALLETVTGLETAWAEAADATEMTRDQLMRASEELTLARRQMDALLAEVAAEISHESRTELGPDGLAKQHGYRSTTQLIAASTRGTTGEAAQLVKVGEAIAPRSNLLGEKLPAKYPFLQKGIASGDLSMVAAAQIIAMLDRVRIKVGTEKTAEAEEFLTSRAAGQSLDNVRKLVVNLEAHLDPDGIEPSEEERRARRSATMFERDGNLHVHLVTPVEEGAPIRAAVQGYVSGQFAARKDAVDPDGPDADHRTVQMMQADAFTLFCQHMLACSHTDVPLHGATVIVRIGLEDLTSGTGHGTIDGADAPISVSAVRRMAAGGSVIPCVLGSGSEILDWGREKRLFTRAQKLALAERDGGCAMCDLPPGMTKAHHLRWWERDAGPTDLDNGVLLCESCHHRIHDNGWEIRIDGTGTAAHVWFVPPPHVDPSRRPRLGGRARYAIAA
ncbi:HNH endonuclease [Microbacterium sp. KUDC0406]|uniref:HNH endonuclease signature motif containing protein n=1 Tax=Microbacterium sp. KUDC0406 TaxID=2909588 RepID=UPI001F2E4C6C|nr:HNH endonuclease signature motif containing protein [Microbacterium sp. KUDC0406]UJP09849.1 HNH endonuclease [Microbacterium sp. KUDC0406]